MQKVNLFSVHEFFKADCFVNVKFIASLLLVFLLVTVSLAQADGLFDFQMKLAKGGNAEAQYKVGEMYETGFGVKQDKKEAMSWMTKSSDQGHETAGFKESEIKRIYDLCLPSYMKEQPELIKTEEQKTFILKILCNIAQINSILHVVKTAEIEEVAHYTRPQVAEDILRETVENKVIISCIS